MATVRILTCRTEIKRINETLGEATDVTNNTTAAIYAGVLVEVTKPGGSIVEELDPATTVEILPGATASIDPAGVTNAVGVAFNSITEGAISTASEMLVRN